MRIKINTHSIGRTILVVYFILISGAWTIEIPSFVRLVINSILGIYSLLTVLNIRESRGSIFGILMPLLLVISMLLNGDLAGWINYVSIICFICIGLYISNVWGIKDFAKRYCGCLCVISFISLICYIFRNLLFQFSSGFPIVHGHSVSYINYYIYLYCREAPYRNCAIFWEPGAFAVFIGVAILFAFSYLDDKRRNRQLIIYFLSLITTGSTLAYTLILLSVLIYMLTIDKGRSKIWKMVFGLVSTIAIVFILYEIGAIQNINDKLFEGLKTNASSRGRYIGQLADFRLIANSPITGVGTSSYIERASIEASKFGHSWDVSTNTYTSMGAMFGIPVTLMVIYGLVRFYNKEDFLLKTIFIIFGLWIFITEAFLFKPLFYILVMGGISSRAKVDGYQELDEICKEKKENEAV